MAEPYTDSHYLTNIFLSRATLQTQNYDVLYQCDELVTRIINLYPDEAYATGFKVSSENEDFYNTALNSLDVWELFRLASIWSRLNGLSVILIGASGEPSQPLKNEKVEFLKLYHLEPSTDISRETVQIGSNKFHKSRLMFFKGKELLVNYGEIRTAYCSVLDGCIDVLEKYRQLPDIILLMIKMSNQVALGTEGLGAGIRQDIITRTTTQRDNIQARLDSLNNGRNFANLLLYDKTNEVISNTSLSLAGVAEQVQNLENQLTVRTDYPKKVLFQDSGTTANGLGLGVVSQLVERMVWASKVSRWIDNNWVDNVEKLCNQLKRSLNLSEFEISVPLSFIMSPQEKAEINKAQTEILNTIVTLYPMELEDIQEYINNNFEDLWIPEPSKNPVTVPTKNQADIPRNPVIPLVGTVPDKVTDSITDDLSQLTVINDRALTEVMTKIGEQSK